MNLHSTKLLITPSQPWLLRVAIGQGELADTLCHLLQEPEFKDTVLRYVRGKRMCKLDAMFDEFAATFQFPYYFGHNWPAFDDCMEDLDWLPGAKYLLVILDSAQLLRDDEPVEMKVLFKILEKVCREWGTPIAKGECWDRPAKPFHVLFQCTPEEINCLPEIIRSLPDELVLEKRL